MTSPVEMISDPQFLGGIFQEIENAYNAADYEETLSGFLPDLVASHAGHFSERRDSSGSIWPPLAAATIARKGHDVPLVETNRLKESVLSLNHPDHVGGVTHRGLLFGTEVEYGMFHQEGTKRIPQRAFVGLESPLLEKIVSGVADHVVESMKFKI